MNKILKPLNFNLKNTRIIALILAIVSFSTYFNSIQNPYLWDDEEIIKPNYSLRNTNSIYKLFSKEYFDVSGELSYRPVHTLSLIVSNKLFGPSPEAQRFINITIHSLNTILVYLVARNMAAGNVAVLAGLLFAVHPVHTETINCIIFRHELLGCLFFLLALILMQYNRQILALLCYAAGLLAKEFVVTLPVMFFLYDWFFYDKEKRVENKYHKIFYIGSIIITICYLFLRFYLFANPEHKTTYPGGNIYTNFLTMVPVAADYLKLLVLPVNLAVSYDIPVIKSWLSARFIIASLVLIVLCVVCVLLYRKEKKITFYILWIGITIMPVLNFIPFLYYALLFERYLYIPSIGYCVLLSTLISKLSKKMVISSVSILTIFYLYGTVTRNLDWQNGETLYMKNIKIFPENSRVYTFLGEVYFKQGKIDSAIELFNKSIELDPTYFYAFNALACSLQKNKQYDQAILNYQKALQLKPDYSMIKNNLAVAYFEKGMVKEAIILAQEQITQKPNDADAYRNLIDFYRNLNEYNRAIEIADKAFSLKLDSPYIHKSLGMVFFYKKEYSKSLSEFEKAVETNPFDAEIWNNLGVVYSLTGENSEAVKNFEQAIRVNSGYAEAQKNLALCYWKMGYKRKFWETSENYLQWDINKEEKEKIGLLREKIAVPYN